MATAEEYAQWIVNNKDKKGTPEFEKVVEAYKLVKGQKKQEKRSFGQELGRQAGLTGRYAIEGALALPDLLATPFRMAGNAARPGTFTQSGGSAVADMLGLPSPNTTTERLVGDASRALSGVGGIIGGAKAAGNAVSPAVRAGMQWLSDKPALQARVAAASGLGGGGAREMDLPPSAQLAASLLAGTGAAAVPAVARTVLEPVKDIGATIGASMGSRRGAQSIARDTLERISADNRDEIASALRTGKEYVQGAKPTAAEAIAQRNAIIPDRQIGASIARLQRDLTGARSVEDVLPTVMKRNQDAIETTLRNINQKHAPAREAALASANTTGVKAKTVLDKIESMATSPGLRASTLVGRSLRAVKRKIDSLSKDGVIDANDLYTIRKELRTHITAASKKTGNWDKRLTAKLEREVQLAIDDAIEEAGGDGWRAYLKAYSDDMAAIDAHQARLKASTKLASSTKSQVGGSIVTSEVAHPPTLLSRPMMLLNYFLKMVAQDANAPVAKELARLSANPREMAEILSRPASDPLRKKLVEAMNRGAEMAAIQNRSEK